MPAVAAHTVAVVISFVIITSLHIVLGELAPKSLALQRSEKTALAIVRPLYVFLLLFRPAITVLNGMGNGVLRLVGLQPGHGEGAYHSAAEINLLVAASQEAGLIGESQQAAVERIFDEGERRIREIMTPRHDVTWIDLDDTPEEIARQVLECPHEQVIASRGALDEIEGVVSKKDLLDRLLRGEPLDPAAVVSPPMAVPESMCTRVRARRSTSWAVGTASPVSRLNGLAQAGSVQELGSSSLAVSPKSSGRAASIVRPSAAAVTSASHQASARPSVSR
jgi:putative hemolysin